MTRIFKTKSFVRFARKEGISDQSLCEAVQKAESGLVDADLGGGVIKQRIARPGEGASGGYRGIVLFRSGDKAFFVYGFPKSERENIEEDELRAFKKLAGEMLPLSDNKLKQLLQSSSLTEVRCDA